MSTTQKDANAVKPKITEKTESIEVFDQKTLKQTMADSCNLSIRYREDNKTVATKNTHDTVKKVYDFSDERVERFERIARNVKDIFTSLEYLFSEGTFGKEKKT